LELGERKWKEHVVPGGKRKRGGGPAGGRLKISISKERNG